MPKVLVSACLVGERVRHDGKDKLQAHVRLREWVDRGEVVSICPEVAGGLPTPRPPAEIQPRKTALEVLNGRARIETIHGGDVTTEFVAGARATLALAQEHDVRVAILKAKSPSCGSRQVYDGTHSGALVDGMGVTAALLIEHGIRVFDESEIDAALDLATPRR